MVLPSTLSGVYNYVVLWSDHINLLSICRFLNVAISCFFHAIILYCTLLRIKWPLKGLIPTKAAKKCTSTIINEELCLYTVFEDRSGHNLDVFESSEVFLYWFTISKVFMSSKSEVKRRWLVLRLFSFSLYLFMSGHWQALLAVVKNFFFVFLRLLFKCFTRLGARLWWTSKSSLNYKVFN